MRFDSTRRAAPGNLRSMTNKEPCVATDYALDDLALAKF